MEQDLVTIQKPSSSVEPIDLVRLFTEWNLRHFNGELPIPVIRWNNRLQTTAGRFIPKKKNSIIEIAQYLLEEKSPETLSRDTMGHEMIHYWLWVRQEPYGHTSEFYIKMEEMGVSRYNSVPRHRPFKHCYICEHCEQRIWVRRRLKAAACAVCCNRHAQGKYHAQFKLRHAPDEVLQQIEVGADLNLDLGKPA